MELPEFTIAALQDNYQRGTWTARGLCEAYLARIAALDRSGPCLGAVIELNPDALEIAAALDSERAAQGPRGPLHGLPIMVKDNLDSADGMMTTAGSLALEGHIAPSDAHVVARLRAAGAVLLGKTNLSEWANFRSTRSCSGWSSRGGQVRNPHALDRSPSGSSSGSGAAVAANYCVAAIGTETDGSIVGPACANGIVGLKPTIGLVSRAGIVPIAHSQDTAGPMTRSVADAAAVLSAIAGPDPNDPVTQTVAGRREADYGRFLDPNGLRGARLGLARDYLGRHEAVDRIIDEAVARLAALGATIVDPVELGIVPHLRAPELVVLLYEFKADLNAYLASHPTAPVRSLAELIAFNRAEAPRAMPYHQQELLEMAEAKGGLEADDYLAARAECLRLARDEGIDRVLREHDLDAIIAPTKSSPAWLIDPVLGDKSVLGCSAPAAVAGYPHITLPAGFVHGLPVGLSFFAGPFEEGKLIGYAYAFEQASAARRAPAFAATAC